MQSAAIITVAASTERLFLDLANADLFKIAELDQQNILTPAQLLQLKHDAEVRRRYIAVLRDIGQGCDTRLREIKQEDLDLKDQLAQALPGDPLRREFPQWAARAQRERTALIERRNWAEKRRNELKQLEPPDFDLRRAKARIARLETYIRELIAEEMAQEPVDRNMQWIIEMQQLLLDRE